MTMYILLGHIATIFLSLNVVTTLSFDSEITSYLYGGAKEELFTETADNMKTLALKPKKEGISSNLLVITKNRKYYFYLRYDQANPHQFLEIKQGSVSSSMKKLMAGNDFDIMEGESSLLLINKKSAPVEI
ncbi:MAG: TrbG/VirB9 family P-type conjugative transfer protein, partial [Pseudomonadota bacterium]